MSETRVIHVFWFSTAVIKVWSGLVHCRNLVKKPVPLFSLGGTDSLQNKSYVKVKATLTFKC